MAKQFEIGKTYTTHSTCDYDCKFMVDVVARTAKTVTFKVMGEAKRVRVAVKDGEETAYAMGRYSMAPIFYASKTA